MLITVAICTWNRSRKLHQLLSSLEKANIPHDLRWEVLIVNNNSTDDTEAVIASHKRTLPIRSVFETRQGIAHARNKALLESAGKYIICLDDDVIAPPDLLGAYHKATLNWPHASFFGAPLKICADFHLPGYISQTYISRLNNFFLRKDLGSQETLLSNNEFPFGANMMLSRLWCEKHLFNTAYGHVGESRSYGEETSFFISIVKNGGHGVWVPGAVANYPLNPDYFSLKSIRNDSFAKGKAHILIHGTPYSKRLSYLPPFIRLRIQLFAALLKLAFDFLLGREWIKPYKQLHVLRGMLMVLNNRD